MNLLSLLNPRDYSLIRGDVIASLLRYEADGVPTGGFLEAVLANDLSGACGSADGDNVRALAAIVSFVYNELNGRCWGSYEVVRAWLGWHAAQRRDGDVVAATEALGAANEESRRRMR